jgi:Helix-turn-helix family
MDATEAARRSAGAVRDLPAGFMMDPDTYSRGAQLGFDGVDFYVAGRGGALGDVCGKVVAATFVFFEPRGICEAWARTEKVMARVDAAYAFQRCLVSWAQAHLSDGPAYGRLAELTRQVVQCGPLAGLPLFAAWSTIEEPQDGAKSLALHRLNLLREMRGGLHGAAVIASGLRPHEAVMVAAPHMAPVLGWGEPHPDPAPLADQWREAEEATNRMMAGALSSLADDERAEFVELAEAALTSRS